MNLPRFAFLLVVFIAGTTGNLHAHCNGGPGVVCEDRPCHHGECGWLGKAAETAKNISSPAAQTEIGNVMIIPKLKLPVSPDRELPALPNLSVPVGQPPALPPPAVGLIRTPDDVDKLKVKVLSAVRDSENARAITELVRKNPKMGANAVNRIVFPRLGQAYAEAEAFNSALQESKDKGADLDGARRLLDSILTTRGKAQ